ncbi:DNA repair protein RecO [Thioclava sp.]|uniref:DNA repair protein RecO n=1 Tax=Thioclava sp. TaxID=1933450 RepID=UPI0032426B8E
MVNAELDRRDHGASTFGGAAAVADIKRRKFEIFDRIAAEDSRPVRPERVIAALMKVLPPDATVVSDPGTSCPYASAYYRQALAGLNAATALLRFTLPEREAHDALFMASEALFDAMAEGGDWVPTYLRWELGLLEEMGYGLDLSRCAVTGSRDDLAYVSPRSGRAVSRQGAGEWAPRLLPLPLCLLGQGPASLGEIVQGLRLTGFFLGERMAPDLGDRPLPEARQRFVDLLGRSAR